jgi:CubicO group peptidase (beta-lactamase class C family)
MAKSFTDSLLASLIFLIRKSNSPDTRFPIASISKTLAATAILQLTEKGKLNPTDPAAKYLPQFPYPGITIKHLLSHSSGLPPL